MPSTARPLLCAGCCRGHSAPSLPERRDADTAAVSQPVSSIAPGDGPAPPLRPPAATFLPTFSSPLPRLPGFEAPPPAHPSARRRAAIDLDECAELWPPACNFLHGYAFETLTKRISSTPHPNPPHHSVFISAACIM